jgi:hypothetical protein
MIQAIDLTHAVSRADAIVRLLEQARSSITKVGIISDEAVESNRAIEEALLACLRLRLQAELMVSGELESSEL